MTLAHEVEVAFDELWASLAEIGRDPQTGGYRRFAWTDVDRELREWFARAAEKRGLEVEVDRNGNVWAWWNATRGSTEISNAFVTGSHLDSVPDGGPFDGPLGVVSALCAVEAVRLRGMRPRKPIGVVVFADEEGARFGVACVGSRLLTGVLDAERARALRDGDGVSLAAAMRDAGVDPDNLGADPQLLRRIGMFVELHVEQGRGLGRGLGEESVAVATRIWPHGRWRFTFRGKANHAGTTRMADRRDAIASFAATVLAARELAATYGGVATFGRIQVLPNAVNAIPNRVDAWLDVRAPDQRELDAIVGGTELRARQRAASDRVDLDVVAESITPAVPFDAQARRWLQSIVGNVPELATAAGHDAGVLAGQVPSAMLFVRNPTGVSHAPDEHVDRADVLAGIEALANAMTSWACT